MRDDNELTKRILALNMARGCPLYDEAAAELIARSMPIKTNAETVRSAMARAASMTQEARHAYGSLALAWGYANGFRLEGNDPETAIDRAVCLMDEDLDVIRETRRHYIEPSHERDLEPTVRLAVAASVMARHTRQGCD